MMMASCSLALNFLSACHAELGAATHIRKGGQAAKHVKSCTNVMDDTYLPEPPHVTQTMETIIAHFVGHCYREKMLSSKGGPGL